MKKFLSAPYWVHLIIDALIGQAIWWLITRIMNIPIEIRSIIAGIILIATIFAVAWYLPKISPKPASANKPTNNAEIVPIVLSRGQLRTDDVTSTKLGRWLLEELTREKNTPNNYFKVQPDWFGLYLNSISGPYLLFRFAIRTSAMHSFIFQLQNTNGHINYMNQDLARIPEVEEGTHDKLNRVTQNMLTVKQFLEPITMHHFKELYNSQRGQVITFGFNGLNVYMKAIRPDGSFDEDLWRLPIPDYKVNISSEIIRA